jgi:hypothetical protein
MGVQNLNSVHCFGMVSSVLRLVVSDIGINTIICFNLLLNAAMVVGFEDTMMSFIRMYNPHPEAIGTGWGIVQPGIFWNETEYLGRMLSKKLNS